MNGLLNYLGLSSNLVTELDVLSKNDCLVVCCEGNIKGVINSGEEIHIDPFDILRDIFDGFVFFSRRERSGELKV